MDNPVIITQLDWGALLFDWDWGDESAGGVIPIPTNKNYDQQNLHRFSRVVDWLPQQTALA